MGSLRPGATYIYEHVNGVTYAREFGAPHNERFEIGRDYESHLKDQLHLWEDIVRAGRTNAALQEALDRAIMIYRLTQTHE